MTLCSKCKKNSAKYIVEYTKNGEETVEYLCEGCYTESLVLQKQTEDSPSKVLCPFCGNTLEDYLYSGLVGCAECYRFFSDELTPYVVRLQGNRPHCGKSPSEYPKYEVAQSLRELLKKQKQAKEDGDETQALKYELKARELKLLLFEDDEEE